MCLVLTAAQKISSGGHCCLCAESAPPTEQSAHEKHCSADAGTVLFVLFPALAMVVAMLILNGGEKATRRESKQVSQKTETDRQTDR